MPRVRNNGDSSGTPKHKARYKRTKANGQLCGQSKYKDDWPDRVIELMAAGKSIYSVAKALGVDTVTINRLAKRVKVFGFALEYGKELSRAWWEEHGQDNTKNRQFQTALYQMQMRNRFKWSSGDKVEHKHDGTVKHKGDIKVTFHKAAKDV